MSKVLTLTLILGTLVAPLQIDAQGLRTPALWVVVGHQLIRGETIEHSGSIVILSGATLELVESSLDFKFVTAHEPRITVKPGGRLLLNGTAARPSAISAQALANPLPPFTAFYWQMDVARGGEFIGNNCDISGTGRNQAEQYLGRWTGIVVEGTIELVECTLHDSAYAIVFNGTQASFRNMTSWGNEGFNVAGSVGDIRIEGWIGTGTFGFGMYRTLSIRGMELACNIVCIWIERPGEGGLAASIQNVTIEGQRSGAAVLMHNARAQLSNITLRNAGGGIFHEAALDALSSNVTVRNLRIEGAPYAIWARTGCDRFRDMGRSLHPQFPERDPGPPADTAPRLVG
jgi:hypothetical protein